MAAAASPLRLSPLEEFMPRAYVRQIYCFPTTSPQAVSTLSRGLPGLARDVPYILSRVVSDKSGTGARVAVSAPCQSPEDIFSWHDLSDSMSYAALKAGHFAPGAFPAHAVAPPDTLPPCPASPAVFLARASLVDGGLILCVAAHHVVTDITGLGALLKIWASHCRDGGSDIGFGASWMDRGPLFSASRSPASTMPGLLHLKTPDESAAVRGTGRAGTGQPQIPYYRTGIFYFPRRPLRVLRDAANAHVASREPGSWVATSDILSSLLWSAIIAARGNPPPLLDSADEQRVTCKDTRASSSTLSFPVQFRSALRPPLPRDFLGAAFVMTRARVPHEDVCRISSCFRTSSTSAAQDGESGPEDAGTEISLHSAEISALAEVALAIRRAVRRIDDAAVRGVLAYLEAHPGTNLEVPLVLGPSRCEAGGSGTSVVSWADQCVYELNWGDAVGQCDTVRLSKMAYQRDPIVLPHIPGLNGDDGGVEVIMSYEADVMQRVIEGPVMRLFATLRCLS
ncbi:hypothetical protein F4824DRAFT_464358 [Ustulina deusta]|nr:hypothetical protein F4824DRAFT_464358 [Ustulina deusta]